jgi:hypothetical protein
MVSLPGGAEQALPIGAPRGSQTTPAIFGGDVAYAEELPGDLNPRIMRWRHATGTTRRLPGGSPAAACEHRSSTCGSVVLQMDMSARIVAYNWLLRGPDADYGIGPEWELRGDHIPNGRRYLQEQGYISGACGATVPDSPSIDAHGYAWLESREDCDQHAHQQIIDNAFPRQGWLSAQPPDIDYPPGSIYAMARDGQTIYWLAGPHTEDAFIGDTDHCAKGCLLMRSRHLDFQPVTQSDDEEEDG